MFVGALLTPCNVYSGLKIGWSFNMSIAACLLSLAFWRLGSALFGLREWGLYENNINQTTASSAASIISGGLVAPIPALTLLTGQQLTWAWLWLWVFTVSILGVLVAVTLRNAMIVRDRLSFPAGVAAAETITEIYAHGHEAARRIRMLLGATTVSAGVKILVDMLPSVPRWVPALGSGGVSFKSLGLVLDPSLLMVGFGAIIGLRTGLSLLAGALLAWLGLAPWVVAKGWVPAGAPDTFWFGPLVEWLLWPGVTLMTTSALCSFAFAVCNATRNRREYRSRGMQNVAFPVPRRWFVAGLGLALVLSILVQNRLFEMPVFAAVTAVVLAFGLAIVASRVVGETGIPPIGAIGKVAQLSFGMLTPGNVSSNLMGANVTGGAAGQSANLLNDLKCGHIIGATPAFQIFAQCWGILAGSLVGSLTYLVLIPDPQAMLLTPEWPAPAVATWMAVAEVLAKGWSTLPEGTAVAMAVSAVAGVLLSWTEWRGVRWLPSGTAAGLAFVIPAWISISMFLGALVAAVAARFAPRWSARYVLAIAAGLVAGESLAGIGSAMLSMAAS